MLLHTMPCTSKGQQHYASFSVIWSLICSLKNQQNKGHACLLDFGEKVQFATIPIHTIHEPCFVSLSKKILYHFFSVKWRLEATIHNRTSFIHILLGIFSKTCQKKNFQKTKLCLAKSNIKQQTKASFSVNRRP